MFAIFLYGMNSSIFVQRSAGHPTLLAHRGIAQRFDASHVGNDTCTASLMLAPEHGYLENTIASIRAGLEAGADVTELDVQASLKACLLRYIAYGWTGHVPDACRNHVVLVPINVAPWLWGWPNRFLGRMESVRSSTFVLGPYHGGDFAAGIDTAEDLSRLPAGFSGGIWTNDIALIADRIRSR